MVFQDPMTALNPVLKIGNQITEGLRYHLDLDRRTAQQNAVALLRSVGIPEPERRLSQYPHELSGGMRQRIMIAVALACGPQAAVRRRAHHGARRDRAGADPQPAGPPAARARHGDDPRHPRPRRRRRSGRRHRGHVRRPDRREGARPPRCSPTCACRTPRPCCGRSPSSTSPAAPGCRPSPAARPPGRPAPGAAASPPAARTPRPAATPRRRRSSRASRATTYRCWFPVGVGPHPRAAATASAPHPAPPPTHRRRHLMAGTGTAHLRPAADTLLRVEDLVVEFPAGARRRCTPCRACRSTSAGARRSGSSASRVAASRRPARPSIQLPAPTSGRVRFDGTRPDGAVRQARCAGSAPGSSSSSRTRSRR